MLKIRLQGTHKDIEWFRKILSGHPNMNLTEFSNEYRNKGRLFTHVLGHSGWEHFIGNMAYILLLGPMLEEKYGSGKILQIIAITAAVTGVINYVFFWNVALCGASGICFAFILLSSFTSFREGEIPLTVILVAAIYLGQQIYEGIAIKDDISNMAHIFGGIVGGITGFSLNKKSKYGM